ncbi:MAG TPA: hypothetical protein VF793_15495 [Telluria sp.]|jgi:hypothetical protein
MADNISNPQDATPPSPGAALSTARKVEELADHLSACADAIHARVMRDIQRASGDVPESEKNVARTLLDAEQELRQRADRLYADAASCIVGSLGQSQQHLIQLTTDAAARIQAITRIGDGITLVARLLGVAAAAILGQGIALVTALEALDGQLATVAAHTPPPTPTAPAPTPASSA